MYEKNDSPELLTGSFLLSLVKLSDCVHTLVEKVSNYTPCARNVKANKGVWPYNFPLRDEFAFRVALEDIVNSFYWAAQMMLSPSANPRVLQTDSYHYYFNETKKMSVWRTTLGWLKEEASFEPAN